MAKKKESILKNWEEVDSSLKKLGELQLQKSKLEGQQTLIINKVKERYANKCKILDAESKYLKTEIRRYCEQNKETFLKKRSKKLNFGILAYRVSEKVIYSCESTIIKALKSLNLDFCLRIKEEVDKDKLKELDTNILTKIGVQIVKDDKLTIEPDIVEIVTHTKD